MNKDQLFLIVRASQENRECITIAPVYPNDDITSFYTTDTLSVVHVLKNNIARAFLFPQMQELSEADIILK